jgi:hypothetical protein
MNRTVIRNLIVALPLAAGAITMAPGVAMADDGPIIGLPPPSGDPEGPVIGIPEPEPTHPDGPGDLTAPQPCPTHGDCGGSNGGGEDGDQPADKPDVHNVGGLQPKSEVEHVALPTRIDAGLAPVQQDENGLELTWLLAGGALVTASGAAFAARRVRNRA